MNRRATRKTQTASTMSKMHTAPCADEVHHIMGRVGRDAACRFFCTYLPRPKNGYNHHDHPQSVLQGLKDSNRADYLRYQEANYQNGNVNKCWWTDCYLHAKDATGKFLCPLAEEPPK